MFDLAGTAKCFGTAFTETKVFDLSSLLELGHDADSLFDWDVCVYAVAVVEVDEVDAEPLEGFVTGFTNIVRVVADFS